MVLFPTSSHASEKTIIATTVSGAPKEPWDPISMINSHIVALLQQLFLQMGSGKNPSRAFEVPTIPHHVQHVSNRRALFIFICAYDMCANSITDFTLQHVFGNNKCPLNTLANQQRINIKWQPGLALIAGWILVYK